MAWWFLGCVLDSFVHVWFVPGSVSCFSRSTGAVNPPKNPSNQSCSVFPLLLPPLSVY